MRLIRVAAVLMAIAVLSACSELRPGAAVIVGGEPISMTTVNRFAEELCAYSAGSGQAAEGAQLRQAAAVELAFSAIATDIVERENLDVDEAIASVSQSEREQIEAQFGDKASKALARLEGSKLLGGQLVAIGADRTGQTPNEDILNPLAEAGQEAVAEQFRDLDVTFSPGLGLTGDGQPLPDPSRLSVAFDSDQQRANASVSAAVGCDAT